MSQIISQVNAGLKKSKSSDLCVNTDSTKGYYDVTTF